MNVSEREQKIFDRVAQVAQKYEAEKVILFGSRARRTHSEKSDIDLAVYGCSDFEKLYFEIQEEVETLLMFDIIDMKKANISQKLKEEIASDGVIIYEKI